MFSNAVKLADLDDYLSPAQDCVKPIIDAVNKDKNNTMDDIKPAFEVRKEDTVRPNLIKSNKDDAKAQVNLVDCLACSGCVTSAEAVLIEQQGVPDFLQKVRSRKFSAVSVTAQSCTSLANHFGLSLNDTMRRLATLFRRLGVRKIYDMSVADAISLELAYSEFKSRLSAHLDHLKNSRSTPSPYLPMLTSHCPGWVVYAEKTVDEAILQHICTARPAQEIQGLLVKAAAVEAFNLEQLMAVHNRLSVSNIMSPAVRMIHNYTNPLFNLGDEVNGGWNVTEKKKSSGCDDCAGCGTGSCGPAPTRERIESDDEELSSDGDDECCTTKKPMRTLPIKNQERLVRISQRMRQRLLVSHRGRDTVHVVLQPCFDKKLEAARSEFRGQMAQRPSYLPGLDGVKGTTSAEVETSTKEGEEVSLVDGVLATSEVLALLEEVGVQSLADLPASNFDALPNVDAVSRLLSAAESSEEQELASQLDEISQAVLSMRSRSEKEISIPVSSNFSSGGFAAYILYRALKEGLIPGGSAAAIPDDFKGEVGRNKHMRELAITFDDQTDSQFAGVRNSFASGFRNIQNILKQVQPTVKPGKPSKASKSKADPEHANHLFAVCEVLACPSGCLNGGGQAHAFGKATASGSTVALPQEAEKRLNDLEMTLHSADSTLVNFSSPQTTLRCLQVSKDCLEKFLSTQVASGESVETLVHRGADNPDQKIVVVAIEQLRRCLRVAYRSLKAKEGELTASALKW